MTGRKLGAEKALRVGLVSRISTNQELVHNTGKVAKEITEAPLDALVYTKSDLRRNLNKGFEESFTIEHYTAFKTSFRGLKRPKSLIF